MQKDKVKQAIVIRKDLKMRRGKEIAQGAHASMKWLVDRINTFIDFHPDSPPPQCVHDYHFKYPEIAWMTGLFTKVCLQVNSEQELLDVYEAAKKAGLEASLITDAGLTEFNGEPTTTCCAIGPDYEENIDKITKELKLY